MKNEAANRPMTILINISLIIFVFGVIFRIQHWPYGSLISTIGLICYGGFSQIEIRRLRKIIANFSKEVL